MNVDVQAMARRLQESLGTVIVGKEAEIELCIVGLLCRGHLLIEDVPGHRQDAARQSARPQQRLQLRASAVHPGPAPGRRDRGERLQPAGSRRSSSAADRSSPRCCSPMRSTGRRRRRSRRCSRRWRSGRSPSTAPAIRSPIRSWCWRRRTRSSWAERSRFPRRRSTASCSSCGSGTCPRTRRSRCSIASSRAARSARSRPVTDAVEIKAAQEVCRDIYCDATLKDYCVRIVRRTREHRDVSLGSSPRGTLGLLHAGQARAALAGRDFVLPDDIKDIAAERARAPRDAPSERRAARPHRGRGARGGAGDGVGADDGPASGVTGLAASARSAP